MLRSVRASCGHALARTSGQKLSKKAGLISRAIMLLTAMVIVSPTITRLDCVCIHRDAPRPYFILATHAGVVDMLRIRLSAKFASLDLDLRTAMDRAACALMCATFVNWPDSTAIAPYATAARQRYILFRFVCGWHRLAVHTGRISSLWCFGTVVNSTTAAPLCWC
jgi:hypothetical protein